MKRSQRASFPGLVETDSLGEVLSFMRLLWAVTHGLESTSKRMRRSVGVTGPQRLVIRLIGRYRGISPGTLAELLHVHPSSLTGVLRRLEVARLISRRRDPADGRRAVLALTDRGQSLNDRRSGTVESAVRRALNALPASQVHAARAVLGVLARELGVE